jgi:hypothetical protein
MKRMGILLAAAFALAACATGETVNTAASAPGGERDCFRSDDVNGYSIIDDHNIGLRARSKNYILTTAWNTRDLDWTHAIGIRSTSGWICTGSGIGVDVIGGEPSRNYPISSIARAPNDEQPTGS